MPRVDSLCGSASSTADADFQIQANGLTDTPRPILDSNSEVKAACCQSSASTDLLARVGSEGPISRKRCRHLDDFENDVLFQSGSGIQQRCQVS